jgi:tetratricopeptide (TPR) repeat protein
VGDPATLALVLLRGYMAAIELRSDPAAFERWRNELAAVGRHLGDPALEFWGAVTSWVWAVMTRDLPSAIDAVGVVRRLGEDLGQPTMRWMATFVRSAHCSLAGRFGDAEALAHEAFELGSAVSSADAARALWTQLFWIRYDQGRMAEALDVFVRAASRQGARSHTRVLFCLLLCEVDRPDDARPVFDALAADDFAAVGYPWLQNLVVLAKVCPALGDERHAAFLRDRLEPHHALVPSLVGNTIEPVAHHLGLLTAALGRYDDAQAHFEEAAKIAEQMEAPHWLARTRLERARMLARRAAPGDSEQVRLLAGAALATAEELGMARVAEQARALTLG